MNDKTPGLAQQGIDALSALDQQKNSDSELEAMLTKSELDKNTVPPGEKLLEERFDAMRAEKNQVTQSDYGRGYEDGIRDASDRQLRITALRHANKDFGTPIKGVLEDAAKIEAYLRDGAAPVGNAPTGAVDSPTPEERIKQINFLSEHGYFPRPSRKEEGSIYRNRQTDVEIVIEQRIADTPDGAVWRVHVRNSSGNTFTVTEAELIVGWVVVR